MYTLGSSIEFVDIVQLIYSALRLLGRHDQLSPEDFIPEGTGDTEAELVIQKVMSQMVFLEALEPQRRIRKVYEVVRQVITNIAEDGTAVDCGSRVPAPEDDGMRKPPPGSCKNSK
jgi:hypothetical protein